jgi:DDE superfamily endonuclease
VPLSLITARGVMLATIIRAEPTIMLHVFKDGSSFRASDSFVRKWLHSAMGWSRRKGTRAAHKLPKNWEDQCEQSAIRKAYLLKEYDIPAELYANSDQTQRLYAAGDKLTYAEIGAKQVSVIGGDEKRAFTVIVTITSAGRLLPFQAIYMGKTQKSCPNAEAPRYAECIAAGFRFDFSGTRTYWSNQQKMREFVDHILAPYFEETKARLGCLEGQRSLWTIDVWAVHRSEAFLDWMANEHPTILIDFVPGGCTGVAQPCDVGIQRAFKHVTNQCFMEDVVDETLIQIDKGDGENFCWDDGLPTLRNASVRWLWKAYETLNKKEIVQKVSDAKRMGWSHWTHQDDRRSNSAS